MVTGGSVLASEAQPPASVTIFFQSSSFFYWWGQTPGFKYGGSTLPKKTSPSYYETMVNICHIKSLIFVNYSEEI
jgi:hypothetical protein